MALSQLKDFGWANLHAKSRSGNTLLHYTARDGNLYFFRDLVKNLGFNVYEKNNNGRNSLHVASVNGSNAIVNYLVNTKGMDINLTDRRGKTALKRAEAKLKKLRDDKKVKNKIIGDYTTLINLLKTKTIV